MKLASIDIGSNAIRLLLCNVVETVPEPLYKNSELIRIPLRLGDDAFLQRKISDNKTEKLISTMHAFKHLMKVYEAKDYKACATSAMREATNSLEIIERVKKETGLIIDLIDGKTEAEMIYANHVAEHLELDHDYLYIDVGGGSTELTLFSKGKMEFSQSFNIGTIRLLYDTISKDQWVEFREKVAEITKDHIGVTAIGSGGNINKIFKMIKKKDGKPVFYSRLKEFYYQIQSLTVEERINVLGLNPDRADVIVPAAKILTTVMKYGNIEQLIVPQIGLSDGIIHYLYEKNKLD